MISEPFFSVNLGRIYHAGGLVLDEMTHGYPFIFKREALKAVCAQLALLG